MVEIYRVEHKDTKVGPFQTNTPFTQDLVSILVSQLVLFPSPYDDGLGLSDIPFKFVFGCPSIETMKKWILVGLQDKINKYIVKELERLGFVLMYYVVEDDCVRFGKSGTQVAFSANAIFDDCDSEALSLDLLLEN